MIGTTRVHVLWVTVGGDGRLYDLSHREECPRQGDDYVCPEGDLWAESGEDAIPGIDDLAPGRYMVRLGIDELEVVEPFKSLDELSADQRATLVVPETTDNAYNLGKTSGLRGLRRLARHEFFGSNGEEETHHPFPQSLYRAYLKGWKFGRDVRHAKAARRLGEAVSTIREKGSSVSS